MSASTAPRVSVVIPTYNMEKHIRRTIRSVQEQTTSDLEIIVIDDCSTDTTPEIVEDLAQEDIRIRYHRLEKNSNLPAIPRNAGIELSAGEYVAFLDHDDIWSPDKISRQVAFLDRHPEMDMAHAPLWVHVRGSRWKGILRLPNPFQSKTTLDRLLRGNPIMCSSVIVRRPTLVLLGGFNEAPGLRTVEDYELWLRIAQTGRIGFQPFLCGSYFLEAGGALSQDNAQARLADLRLASDLALAIPASGIGPSVRQALLAPAFLAVSLVYLSIIKLKFRTS